MQTTSKAKAEFIGRQLQEVTLACVFGGGQFYLPNGSDELVR